MVVAIFDPCSTSLGNQISYPGHTVALMVSLSESVRGTGRYLSTGSFSHRASPHQHCGDRVHFTS